MITAQDIASFLNTDLIGENIELKLVSSLGTLQPFSMAFIKNPNINENKKIKVLYIVPLNKSIDHSSHATYIKVANPRLAFAKAVNAFFVDRFPEMIDNSAQISKNVKLGQKVYIGKNTVVDENVVIGDNTVIRDNVVIHKDVIIGSDCLIKSGVVIGEDGFGFDFEEDGTPVKLPHLGKVVIGNRVEIGANTVIARGTLDDTIIENDVKIDALVHIAHNCYIDEKTSLIAASTLSGSVHIGKRCWIAPNSTIYQKKVVGDDVKIGLGAVVVNDIKNKDIIMGLEAINVFDLYKFKLKSNYSYSKFKEKENQ